MAGNIFSTPCCSSVGLTMPTPVGLSQPPQVALVGFLHLGQFLLDGDLDAEFLQVRE